MRTVCIFWYSFSIATKSYIVSICWNRLVETIPTNGHNIGISWVIRELAFKNLQQNKIYVAPTSSFTYLARVPVHEASDAVGFLGRSQLGAPVEGPAGDDTQFTLEAPVHGQVGSWYVLIHCLVCGGISISSLKMSVTQGFTGRKYGHPWHIRC